MKLRFRLAVLAALLALGSCLWRPPVIPPLASANDAGAGGTRDASVFSDSAAPPSEDSSAGFTDREACDNAARANDGAVPSTVLNDGRVVICSSDSDATAPGDATTSADVAGDAAATSDASANRDASADGERDGAADDAGEADAGEAG